MVKTTSKDQKKNSDPDLVEELEKELEATGKRSLNCSIILILVIIPFLILLFVISSSSESPYIATQHNRSGGN